jgi:hypothetical protein
MDNSYIIAYQAGCSGRFIGYILKSLLSSSTEEFLITPENSAHFYDSITGVKFNALDPDSNSSKVYEHVVFKDDAVFKILLTHTFPKIDIISKRFPNTKIIVISFTKEDGLEIIGNSVYKNWLAVNEGVNAKTNLEKQTTRLFKKSILKKDLILDQIKIIIEDMAYWNVFQTKHLEYISPFLNTTISYHNLLTLPYREIHTKNENNEYIGLKKLEQLTGITASEIIKKNYEKYVAGRDILISTKMPWLL